MRNRFFKTMSILTMLLLLASPTQVLAASNGNLSQSNVFSVDSGRIFSQRAEMDRDAFIRYSDGTLHGIQLNLQLLDDQTANQSATDQASAETAATALGNFEQKVVDLVNAERAAAGLAPLKINIELSAVAELKAEDMRDNNYFSHTSPTYGSAFDMMKQFGVSYASAGENLAKGHITSQAVMEAWMTSAGHRANILNAEYTEIGVGYVKDSAGTTYWVQHFISR